jgi:hypothetical protein
MTDELVFYTHPMSRGRIVRWMLEEVGQPYRTEILDYGTTMKGPEYLAINPMGKVPALRHGETVVTETAAICAYLADAFPEAGLAPSHGSRLRGSLLQLAVLRCGSGRLRSMTGDALRPPVSMPVRSVERLRAICLALPAAVEKETWGDPTFRVEVVRQSRSSAGPASVMINVAKSSAGSEREQRSPRWRASSIPVVRPSCACGTQCLRLDEVTTFSSG